MSRFYVGQRVRLVKCSDRKNEGKEATVIAYRFSKAGHPCVGGFYPHDVHYVVNDEFGKEWSPAEWQMEPITDCYDKTTWDECIWRPSDINA